MNIKTAIPWIAAGLMAGALAPLSRERSTAGAAMTASSWRPTGEPCSADGSINLDGAELFGYGKAKYYIVKSMVYINDEGTPIDTSGVMGMLGGLDAIAMPTLENASNGAQIKTSFRFVVSTDDGDKEVCLPPSAETVKSWGWCSLDAPGARGIRYTVHQTLRTRVNTGFGTIPSCPAQCLGWTGYDDCDETPLGPPVVATMYPGNTFPVALWQTGDWAFSQERADMLYKQGIFDDRTVASNQSFDIIAGGIVGKAVGTGVKCPWNDELSCEKYVYSRALVGSVVRRTYNDLRIGMGADSAGGMRVQANFTAGAKAIVLTVPSGSTSTDGMTPGDIKAWEAQQGFDRLLVSFCGGGGGAFDIVCGLGNILLPNDSTGGTIFVARDDSVRMLQLCNAVIGQPGVCMSDQNPMSPEALSDPATLDALLQDRLTPGARQEDTVSTGGRLETGHGVRQIEGQTLSTGSQWKRRCKTAFGRDSIRAVDRDESMAAVRQKYMACLIAGRDQ